MNETDFDTEVQGPPATELSKPQRRVLGVLVEKAFTTPEYYPMTLKAVTAGCNQKSNRMPVVNYSEDEVVDVLDSLRELGLVAVIHTESGRTERYRHYMRKRYTFSEPQLAILIELLLRGRQTLGELRARASRMVPIESLEQLRTEVQGLVDMNYVQASDALERRGVEVDHTFYKPSEGQRMSAAPAVSPAARAAEPSTTEPSERVVQPHREEAASAAPAALSGSVVDGLRVENQELRRELESLRDEVRDLERRFEDLRRDLGA